MSKMMPRATVISVTARIKDREDELRRGTYLKILHNNHPRVRMDNMEDDNQKL